MLAEGFFLMNETHTYQLSQENWLKMWDIAMTLQNSFFFGGGGGGEGDKSI